MIAPVSVARSIMNFGLKRFCVYQSASAKTRRPSASVLSTAMVLPDMDVTISPGRWAVPLGMFSTRPITPTALTRAFREASACIRPVTHAAPPMSPFMSSMPAAGFIEMPPVSNVTPLPTKARGGAPFLPPAQRITTSRASFAEPLATPSNAPMPSLFMSRGDSTSTFSPSLPALSPWSANTIGVRWLAGSLTRSRAR